MKPILTLSLLLLVLPSSLPALWPQFRGPEANGTAPNVELPDQLNSASTMACLLYTSPSPRD